MIRQNPDFIRVQHRASYDWPDSRVLLNTEKKVDKGKKKASICRFGEKNRLW